MSVDCIDMQVRWKERDGGSYVANIKLHVNL